MRRARMQTSPGPSINDPISSGLRRSTPFSVINRTSTWQRFPATEQSGNHGPICAEWGIHRGGNAQPPALTQRKTPPRSAERHAAFAHRLTGGHLPAKDAKSCPT
jgi:hypothetical protein